MVFDSAGRQAKGGETPLFSLIASRDIAEGTELCISYCCTDDNARERQEYLKAHYSFVCNCCRCSCDDFEADLTMGEAMEEMRCCDEECGSGLGVPVDVSADARRCVHCNAEWD